MKKKKLQLYVVESLHKETGLIEKPSRLAVSVEDALRLERMEFGEPIYRVLRAYPSPINNTNNLPLP